MDDGGLKSEFLTAFVNQIQEKYFVETEKGFVPRKSADAQHMEVSGQGIAYCLIQGGPTFCLPQFFYYLLIWGEEEEEIDCGNPLTLGDIPDDAASAVLRRVVCALIDISEIMDTKECEKALENFLVEESNMEDLETLGKGAF